MYMKLGSGLCSLRKGQSVWGWGEETGRQFTEVAPRNTFLLGREAGKRPI